MAASQLERFLRIFGTVADSVKTDIERMLDNYKVDTVEAELLPYIDRLIGWPTNFELPEGKRRKETLNAVALYKRKGRADAIEAFVEAVAEWDVTTYEGWRYVMFSNDTRCTTPDMPSLDVGLIGTVSDELKYTPTQDNWHCLNGLVLVLEPVGDVTSELTSITINKIDRIVPGELKTSWAKIAIFLRPPVILESIAPPVEEHVEETINYIETLMPPEEESFALWGPGILLMVSNVAARTTNTIGVRTHHEALGYAGASPPPPYP
jgi:phage tail-like protein